VFFWVVLKVLMDFFFKLRFFSRVFLGFLLKLILGFSFLGVFGLF
jgi:hypothetical protein